MQSYPEKMSVKVAAAQKTKINLSGDVYSTSDFGFLKPIFCRETLPADSFHIGVSSFTRLAPMPVPPLVNINMHNRAFYVRMRNIWPEWTSFITRQPDPVNGVTNTPTKVPTIQNNTIVSVFTSSLKFTTNLGLTDMSGSEIKLRSNADFCFQSSSSASMYDYAFTAFGRKMYDLLISLGYSLNFTYADNTQLSLLPLLAYCRIYYDYFLPSQYKNSWDISSYFAQHNWNDSIARTFFNKLVPLFSFLENDYFTSAWLQPFGPNAETGVDTIGITNYDFGNNTDDEGNIFPQSIRYYNGRPGAFIRTYGEDDTDRNISATGIKNLLALQNYLNRKMIAGTQYYEFLRATYGIHIPEAVINRSQFCGSATIPVQISDVTSTASTGSTATGDYQPLGDFAGKGLAYGKSHTFNVECNEHGYVIVLSTILPHTGYYQGRNRELQHIGAFDFFTPEFETKNTQAIRNDELFASYINPVDYNRGQQSGGKPDGIFGYAPRYAEYKKGNDIVSGDFRLHSLEGQDYNAWHLMRTFLPPTTANPLALNSMFLGTDPNLNGNNFDRIFNYVGLDSPDHFITVHHIDCYAFRRMRSISDSIETEGSETIDVQTQGSRL